jgi:hypothetical protein
LESALHLSSKWYVDPQSGVDMNLKEWRLPPIFPIQSPDDDADMISSYGNSARDLLVRSGMNSVDAEDLSDHDAFLKLGYIAAYVDPSRSAEITSSVKARKFAMQRESTATHDRPQKRRTTDALTNAVNRVKQLTNDDPWLIALSSLKLTPTEVVRAIGSDIYVPGSSDRSRCHRRIKVLLEFVDPLNYAEIDRPGSVPKRRS